MQAALALNRISVVETLRVVAPRLALPVGFLAFRANVYSRSGFRQFRRTCMQRELFVHLFDHAHLLVIRAACGPRQSSRCAMSQSSPMVIWSCALSASSHQTAIATITTTTRTAVSSSLATSGTKGFTSHFPSAYLSTILPDHARRRQDLSHEMPPAAPGRSSLGAGSYQQVSDAPGDRIFTFLSDNLATRFMRYSACISHRATAAAAIIAMTRVDKTAADRRPAQRVISCHAPSAAAARDRPCRCALPAHRCDAVQRRRSCTTACPVRGVRRPQRLWRV